MSHSHHSCWGNRYKEMISIEMYLHTTAKKNPTRKATGMCWSAFNVGHGKDKRILRQYPLTLVDKKGASAYLGEEAKRVLL